MRKTLFLIVLLFLLLSIVAAVIHLYKISPEEIILEYWTHEDDDRAKLEERLIKEFESKNKSIKIKRVSYTSSEHINIVPASMYSGNGPAIFSLIQTSLPPLIEGGYLDECPRSLKDEEDIYVDGVLDAAEYNGRLYGLPMEYTSWVLYVNDEVLEEASIALESKLLATWEGIKELSETISEREADALTKRGFDFRYPYYLNFFIPMVNQLGGGIAIENGCYKLVGEESWVEVFDFFKEWGPDGDNLGSPTYVNARTVFAEGNAAMMLSGLYHEARLEREYKEFYESGKWSVHPFPYFKDGRKTGSAKYVHYWCVNNNLDKREKKAAWSFIEFLSEHYREYLEEVKLIMPKRELFENISDYDIPYLDIFIDDLEQSSFIFTGKSSETLRSILEECVNLVMLKDIDSTKCVERLSSILKSLPL